MFDATVDVSDVYSVVVVKVHSCVVVTPSWHGTVALRDYLTSDRVTTLLVISSVHLEGLVHGLVLDRSYSTCKCVIVRLL